MWFGSDINSNGDAIAPPVAPDVKRHLEGLNRGELYICDNPADPAIFIRLADNSVIAFRPYAVINGDGGNCNCPAGIDGTLFVADGTVLRWTDGLLVESTTKDADAHSDTELI